MVELALSRRRLILSSRRRQPRCDAARTSCNRLLFWLNVADINSVGTVAELWPHMYQGVTLGFLSFAGGRCSGCTISSAVYAASLL
jgi:hypothetical protein